jgi:ribosomal protein S18 acetylase RimI-like enzyme
VTEERLELRPLDVGADLGLAADLVARAQRQAIGRVDSSADFVAALLTSPASVRSEHRVAWRGAMPVGLLAVECDRPSREVFIDAFATTEAEPTLGRLVDAGLEAARRIAGEEGAPPPAGVDPHVVSASFWQVTAGHRPEDEAYGRVLADRGFRAVRRFWRMGLDLVDRPTADPQAPEGVVARRAVDDADRRVVHAIDQACFADHFGVWEHGGFEAWLDDISSRPGHDPDRWWIAELDGSPVGICLLDTSMLEQGEDHVRRLGVLPAARGRGIGRWLLERAASQAAAEGRRALTLSVDGENATGATRLYESVGFTVRHVVDVWCRPLYPTDASADSR